MTLDPITAGMLGSAVGDALGGPTEFKKWQQICAAYGPDGLTEYEPAYGGIGRITDDTQMAIAVATGLLRSPSPNLVDPTMDAIAVEFVSWLHLQRKPGMSRAPGNTCMAGCRMLDRGTHWSDSGRGQANGMSKGNGAVMRAHPIAFALAPDPRYMAKLAAAQARATHGHPTASAAAVLWAGMLAITAEREDSGWWTSGMPDPQAVWAELDESQPGARDLIALHKRVLELVDDPRSHREVVNALGGCWTADEAVAAATLLWLRIDGHHAFETAVLAAANIDGDSDTLACMVGALFGASYPDQVVDRWLAPLEDINLIRSLACGLRGLRDQLAASQY